ncbi:RDD family protein [Nitrosopumilus sp. b3]|uniref:RDD family protein n=1 Tax=Nitrosopumilus sp. b3 TaxID=2109909 RepID=UPI0015F5EBFE|nr:RDD family protein [Nitrosopumilus sp. b3]KAF6247334.1 RDD family protein [Nitrosopumilus sp. b3]
MEPTNSDIPSKIILAKWTDRFFAWLIDFIIISMISTAIIFASFGSLDYEFENNSFWMENIQYIPTSVLFFIYWTVLEYKTGQTVGKKIMNLKIVHVNGKKPSLKGIMISSFGKAFLLPIDVILGWLLTNEKRQRIFNKLSDTVIVKTKDADNVSNMKYLKD